MERPFALIVGGSRWHRRIVESARLCGYRTLVTDISPVAPARSEADAFFQIDTNDRDGLLSLAREHHVALVLFDQTDRTVPVAAWLNEQLGTPGIRSAVALRFTNKLEMRRKLEGSGVAMPRYCEVRAIEDAQRVAEEWGFPVVLKPKDLQASIGVRKVTSRDALARQLPLTLAHARDGHILLEKFIDGPEVTVEGLSLRGEPRVLAISEKAHYDFNDCIAYRLAYPPRFDADLLGKIERAATDTVAALGLDTGFFHGEYRIMNGIPFLMEIAARGAGNGVSTIIAPHVSGLDPYQLLIETLSGRNSSWPPISRRAALLEFFQFEPGRVEHVLGLEAVRDESLAAYIDLTFKAGDTILQPTSDRERLGQFIVLGETRDEVDVRGSRIKSLVRVEYAG